VSRRAKVHPDPIALTSSGDLLVKVGLFDDVTTLDEILSRAKKERSRIFIGVVVEEEEVPLVTDRLGAPCREAAALVVGGRQRRRKERNARRR
jgi:hydrogenase maturation factor